jgi:hypothetical protein
MKNTPQQMQRIHYSHLNIRSEHKINILCFGFIQKRLSQYVRIMFPFSNKQKGDNLYQLGGRDRGGRTKFLSRHEMKKSD